MSDTETLEEIARTREWARDVNFVACGDTKIDVWAVMTLMEAAYKRGLAGEPRGILGHAGA